jgi:hypothetical protein
MWPRVRARLTGDPPGQSLLEAMEDERRLIGSLQAATDDAFTVDADPGRLRQLLTRLAFGTDRLIEFGEVTGRKPSSTALAGGRRVYAGHAARRVHPALVP